MEKYFKHMMLSSVALTILIKSIILTLMAITPLIVIVIKSFMPGILGDGIFNDKDVSLLTAFLIIAAVMYLIVAIPYLVELAIGVRAFRNMDADEKKCMNSCLTVNIVNTIGIIALWAIGFTEAIGLNSIYMNMLFIQFIGIISMILYKGKSK